MASRVLAFDNDPISLSRQKKEAVHTPAGRSAVTAVPGGGHSQPAPAAVQKYPEPSGRRCLPPGPGPPVLGPGAPGGGGLCSDVVPSPTWSPTSSRMSPLTCPSPPSYLNFSTESPELELCLLQGRQGVSGCSETHQLLLPWAREPLQHLGQMGWERGL